MNWLIDITDLISKLIKKELRDQQVNVDLMAAPLKPFADINEEFNTTALRLEYELQFNAQTIYLEHYLNDQYDNINRQIWIENIATLNAVYLYRKSEGQAPTYIYRKSEALPVPFLRRRTEGVTENDYIVWVPVAVVYDETVMRAQINKYNYADKRYTIQTF